MGSLGPNNGVGMGVWGQGGKGGGGGGGMTPPTFYKGGPQLTDLKKESSYSSHPSAMTRCDNAPACTEQNVLAW